MENYKTDADLVKLTLNGDNNAFGILVNRYKTALYWVIYKIVGNPVDAEDITIEVLTKAYHSLASYSPTHAFSTWLHTIGRNKAIDFVRLRNKQPQVLNNPVSTEEDIMTPSVSTDLSAEDNMIRGEISNAVMLTLNDLKPFHRLLIEMKYFKDMSYEEIANELKKPIGTIKTGLFRAKKHLYHLMKHNKNLT